MINRFNLRKISIREFKEIYNKHLKYDFPLSERKPFFLMKKMYLENKYSCYVLEEDNKLKAYAAFVWKCEKTLLLDYFATVKEVRGNGIGSIMLEYLKEELDVSSLILECEHPNYALDEKDEMIRKKRIEFYKKNGAYLTNSEINLAGGKFNIMYLPMKLYDCNTNIKKELDLIYKNMYPKILFRTIAKIY